MRAQKKLEKNPVVASRALGFHLAGILQRCLFPSILSSASSSFIPPTSCQTLSARSPAASPLPQRQRIAFLRRRTAEIHPLAAWTSGVTMRAR